MSGLILTASRMDTKSRCDMRDFYSYHLGYRPVRVTTSLAVGTMTHRGLDGFYQSMNLDGIFRFMAEEKQNDLNFWNSLEGKMAEALSQLYVRGYFNNYKNDFDEKVQLGEIQNIQTEKEFLVEIDGVKFAGKLDLLYMDKDGLPVIKEFKTASMSALKLGSIYIKTLPMSIQTTIYRAAVQRMYSPNNPNDIIPQVIYDIIGKTSKKPSQKRPYLKRNDYESDEDHQAAKVFNVESAEEYIERITPDYVTDDSAYHREYVNVTREDQSVRMSEILLMEAQRPSNNGYALRVRNTNSCSDFGGCPFLEVCLGRESLDSESFVKKEKIHSELTIIKE